MKKRLLFTVALTLWMGLGFTNAQSNNLIVKLTDGTEKSSALSSMSKITFSGTNMVLNYTDGTTGIFDESLVKKLVFNVVSAVEPVFEAGSDLAVFPNPVSDYLQLKNAPDGEISYRIYGLDGAMQLAATLSGGSQQIDVTSLKKGFYVIKVNNQALKFLKL